MVSNVVQFVPNIAPATATDTVKKLTTEQLKRAWDKWDENRDPGCWVLKAIHAEMNARGEGDYVAV